MNPLSVSLAAIPKPKKLGRPDILVIAGEASGDEHAAQMVETLLKEHPEVSIYAFGGKNLRHSGAHFLYDLTQHSVMGFYEVLMRWHLLRKLFGAVIHWIVTHRPRIVCFVDYPGFNLRIAKELFKRGLSHKGGGDIFLCDYISPQIWAWKAKRRFSMAMWLDYVAAIFPFEKQFFRDTLLPVSFVGHPLLTAKKDFGVFYDPEGSLLLLPGSRIVTARRMFPLMLETLQRLHLIFPKLPVAVLYADNLVLHELQAIASRYRDLRECLRFHSIEGGNIPCRACLMTSGTMSLKCALMAIPGVIAYKIHPLTYLLAERLVKVRFIGMANILLDRKSVPEYIQEAASPDVLCREISECLQNPERLINAQQDAHALKKVLGVKPDISVSKWLYKSLENTF
ncbi:MAG: lipid-A-disaccharide synthase [Puniceicoccales bacterium]|jgi:lipid-A-disaccharide synthase|nr:lipid-A-disaccharide synthase [Puniceicoccales bacterium]